MAGPVRPERLLEGAARVEVMLEESERYILVSRFKQDDEGQEQRRYNIVDWKNRTHCELPENIARIERSILGPSGRRKQKPLFLLPVVLQEPGEGEDPGPQVLSFYDESCQVHGETDYGPISIARNTLALDEDGREVLIYGNGKGLLALADPWRDERSEITAGFSAFAFVQRPGSLNSPQLLWVIENGHLTQRALDGTLVLSLGERVSGFAQVLLTQLRVAYLQDGDLFEAVGPDFEPTRIAEDACNFAYRPGFLDLFQPCGANRPPMEEPLDRRLVRTNLMTGESVTFDPGVVEVYNDTGFAFELEKYKDENGKELERQWVTLPGDKVERKFALEKPYVGRPLVLDSSHLVGIKERVEVGEDGMEYTRRALVVTTLERVGDKVEQPEVDVFQHELVSVESFFMIPDYRTSSFYWLVFHDKKTVSDDAAPGDATRGSLSLVSALDRVVERVADDVPLSALPNAPSVRGYSVEVLPTFTKERAIAYIDEAVPLDHDPRGMRGTLHVRLMSGALGSIIASDVTSYHLLSAPLPGVLYGVEEGEQQGLWFAAL